MPKPGIAIVGAGKVGSVLARALAKKGYPLAGVASSTLESAGQLAGELGAASGTRAADMVRQAHLVFITTPDRCIQETAEEIAKNNGFQKGQVVLHMSGCLPAGILKPAESQGAFIGCMHPLQSFADKKHTEELLKGIYFALSGQDEAIGQAQKIAQDLGGSSFVIQEQDKALYHGAACIVSNYTVALMHWAGQLYKRFGLSAEEAAAALLPLLEGTVKNIRELGTVNALTGPVSRGDSITVMAHIRALPNERDKKLYQELGMYTLDIALEKGTVSHEQAAGLAKVLSDNNRGKST